MIVKIYIKKMPIRIPAAIPKHIFIYNAQFVDGDVEEE